MRVSKGTSWLQGLGYRLAHRSSGPGIWRVSVQCACVASVELKSGVQPCPKRQGLQAPGNELAGISSSTVVPGTGTLISGRGDGVCM